MEDKNNDQKRISSNNSERSSLTDSEHVSEFYFDVLPSSEERESDLNEFANVPVTSRSQAQNSLLSQLHSCRKPGGAGLQSTHIKPERSCKNITYTNCSNMYCSEWSNNVFQQICQHVREEPTTEFYFKLLLVHLLKLVLYNARENEEFRQQHLRTQTNYHDDVLNKHRIWQELVRCIHATVCPPTPNGNTHRIADLCVCVNSSTPDLSGRISQQPTLLQWGYQSNSFTDVSLHKEQGITSKASQRLLPVDSLSGKEFGNLHCTYHREAGTQTENPFLLCPLPTVVLDPPPFPPPSPVATKGTIPPPPPIIQVNKTLPQFYSTELAKKQSFNISFSRSTLPFGSSTSVDLVANPTSPAIHKPENSGSLHSLANGRLKPLRWTKVVHVNDSSVWSYHIGSDTNPSGEPELKVDLKQLERLFGRHVRNRSDQLHSETQRVTDEPMDNHYDTNSYNGRYNKNRPSASDLLVDSSAESNHDGVYSLPPTVNQRERSVSHGRRNLSQQRHFESTLLGNKRCLNVNIFLRQFRSSEFNLLEMIERRDSAPLGCERLKCLVKLLPSEHEQTLLAQFDGNFEQLDPAEQFLVNLVHIPNYAQKVDHMLLHEEFLTTVNWIGPAMDKLLVTAKSLITSNKLRWLLRTTLEIGNVLNKGDQLGDATAFKLESLLKLRDVRSCNPKISLLHFLVQHFQNGCTEILRVSEDFLHIKDAANFCTETIFKEVRRMRTRVEQMSRQLSKEDLDVNRKLNTFLEKAFETLRRLDASVNQLIALRKQCADYLCEDSNNFSLNDCFQTLSKFFTQLKHAEQEICAIMNNERLRTQRRTNCRTDNSELQSVTTGEKVHRKASYLRFNSEKEYISRNEQIFLQLSPKKSVSPCGNGKMLLDGTETVCSSFTDSIAAKGLNKSISAYSIRHEAATVDQMASLLSNEPPAYHKGSNAGQPSDISLMQHLNANSISNRIYPRTRASLCTSRQRVRNSFDLAIGRERRVPLPVRAGVDPNEILNATVAEHNETQSSDEETVKRINQRLAKISERISNESDAR